MICVVVDGFRPYINPNNFFLKFFFILKILMLSLKFRIFSNFFKNFEKYYETFKI